MIIFENIATNEKHRVEDTAANRERYPADEWRELADIPPPAPTVEDLRRAEIMGLSPVERWDRLVDMIVKLRARVKALEDAANTTP